MPVEAPVGHVRMAFEDGEIRTATFLDTLPQPPRRGGRRLEDTWSLVFDAGWDILTDARLNQSDARIFFALSRRAPLTGEAWEVNSRAMSERLEMDERRVRRGIANLVKLGLIRRPRKGWIEFNPDYFWRGSSKARVEKRVVAS